VKYFKEADMNIGLLIDINSISSEYIPYIYNEATARGNIIIKKAYGAAENGNTENVKVEDANDTTYMNIREQLADFGISYVPDETSTADRPQAGYGQHGISCQLIIDMLDMAGNTYIEEIHIVTNDEYITKAIETVRAKGKKVVLYGNENISRSFIHMCDSFKYVEILSGAKCQGAVAELQVIIHDIKNMIINSQASGICLTGRAVIEHLGQLHREFDIRNYGYTTLAAFLEENVAGINVINVSGELVIEPVDDKAKIEEWITSFLVEHNNKIEDMDIIYEGLKKAYPHFDTRSYGYTSEIAFILSFPKFEIYDNKGVKLKQTFKLK
jgi:uncharacterized LabA/DUF88 family protein